MAEHGFFKRYQPPTPPEPVPAPTTKLWASCKACGHVWPALHLPMNLTKAATAMSRATCPACGEIKRIFLATSA